MSMTIQSSVKDKILVTSSKTSKECEIRYHPGKTNGVADALSRKAIWSRSTDISVDKTLRLVEEPIEIGDYKGVYVCVYVDYVGVGTQSIERDRLIEIGVVLVLVEFISFTFE
ncbi:hypothetical protein Tco_0079218 [Tanacetum coccineum]